jgi:hypothetical protein
LRARRHAGCQQHGDQRESDAVPDLHFLV